MEGPALFFHLNFGETNMKTGKSLQELAQEIIRQQDSKVDLVADAKALNLHQHGDGFRLAAGTNGDTRAWPVRPVAFDQICDRTGIPLAYARRCAESAPELLSYQVNHWFQSLGKKNLVRVLDGEVRGFLSDRYQRIDHYDIAQVTLPGLLENDKLRVVSCEITERKLYIKAIDEKTVAEVDRGDIIQAGVVISNSEIGFGSLAVQPLVYRLVCKNGLISQDSSFRRHHLGGRTDVNDGTYNLLSQEALQADDKALLLKVRDVVAGAVSQTFIEGEARKLRDAKEDRSDGVNPAAVVEVLGKNLGFTQQEQGGILQRLVEGGDTSRFGFLQAVTRHAQDVDSYDRSTELEVVGGKLAEYKPKDWQHVLALAA